MSSTIQTSSSSLSDINNGPTDNAANASGPAQLNNTSIGIIILCVLFGLGLITVVLLLSRRKRQRLFQSDEAEAAAAAATHMAPKERKQNTLTHRFKERLSWPTSHHKKVSSEAGVDDLVFSAIQEHPPPPPPPPTLFQQPHHHQRHYDSKLDDNSVMYEDGYSFTHSSALHATAGTSAGDTDREILRSLAIQREEDRAGYYKDPRRNSQKTDSNDVDDEEAMLKRLSMSSYHVW